MGFQLVIAEGKETGREFVFEQASVLIGRTSDCDVVLYDPGVSRQHARVFTDGAKFFVEDMGSSNGTKVNGAIVKKKQLADGDAITLGPVVFNFTAIVLDNEPQQGDGSTRIVSAAEVKRSRGKGVAMVPDGAAPDQLAKLSRSSTQTLQAVSRARTSNPAGGAVSRPRSSGGEAGIARPRPSAGASSLSAAERARIKRQQSGAVANFLIWWNEASPGKRNAVYGGVGALVLAAGVGAYFALQPEPGKGLKKPEPTELRTDGTVIEETFGLGEDVYYDRPDQKEFEFKFTAPVDAVVLLHFQARDISGKEVTVSVNGADVGDVPADNMAVNERFNEILIPANLVKKKGETNQVVFDNVKNPPGADPWRIWNVYVEIALLPPLGTEELIADSEKRYQQGLTLYERRSIGAPNLYNAWKAFRTAWLYLESLPEPRPTRYAISRDKMKEVQVELDKTCAKLLLEAQGFFNQKQYNEARRALEHVKEFFPFPDQSCPYRAQYLREAFEL